MRPPQHHRKRGHMPQLWRILRRVSRGMTTHADADWLSWEIITLRSRLDRAEGELKGMRENMGVLKRDRHYWKHQFGEWDRELEEARAKLAAWDRWEHAWVFGGDAAYPGKAGVTDPRETLDALERLALGVPEEEADDGH